MVQWQRIHLPIQGTRVPSLVQEDRTRNGAAESVCHNYRELWTHSELRPLSPDAATSEASASRDHALQQEKPAQ